MTEARAAADTGERETEVPAEGQGDPLSGDDFFLLELF
jgi:hypothetical protein